MSLPRSRTRTLAGPALVATLLTAMIMSPAGVAQAQPDASSEPTQLTVGLGYIPSVQFAQFYLADEAGYYADAGLEVTFQNKIDPELITLLGQGAIDIGMSDGTSLIPAVSQGIPVSYGMTIYQAFPSVVFALADSGIGEAADLRGKRIGIPGRYGSSWIMLQALLASAGVGLDEVEIATYPDFGQAVALAQGQVDAATGFLNNEPVQLRRDGLDITVLRVDDVAPLPGPGLVVGASTLAQKPAAIQAFAAATLQAMREIAADPQRGLDAAFAHVPELAADPATQLAILEATIEAWGADPADFGRIDRTNWASALEIMSSLPDAPVTDPPGVDQLVTDALLPSG